MQPPRKRQPRNDDRDLEAEEYAPPPRPFDPNGEEAAPDFSERWTPPGDYGYQGPGE